MLPEFRYGAAPQDESIDAVRRFSRFYTQIMGLLHRRLLGTDYSLTEARVLLELATRDTPKASDIAASLGIDPAYLSRILKRFERDNLIAAAPDQDDRRGYRLTLTAAGFKVFADLNRRSQADVAATLAHLAPHERTALAEHLGEAERLIGRQGVSASQIVLRQPGTGDLGWIIHRHGVLYRNEYGWDETFEHIVIDILANYLRGARQGRDPAWVADRAGKILGSVFLQQSGSAAAKLRLLYVEPSARGSGLGGLLVDTCIDAARRAGYGTLTLWTMNVLTAACRLYESRGFVLVGEEPVRQYDRDLVSLTYRLDLHPTVLGHHGG